jgi:hypothetical protein
VAAPGLRYAPLAALVAVVAPEVVMTQGQLIARGATPRLYAAAAAVAWFAWRRDMLGTIVAGMAVLLPAPGPGVVICERLFGRGAATMAAVPHPHCPTP